MRPDATSCEISIVFKLFNWKQADFLSQSDHESERPLNQLDFQFAFQWNVIPIAIELCSICLFPFYLEVELNLNICGGRSYFQLLKKQINFIFQLSMKSMDLTNQLDYRKGGFSYIKGLFPSLGKGKKYRKKQIAIPIDIKILWNIERVKKIVLITIIPHTIEMGSVYMSFTKGFILFIWFIEIWYFVGVVWHGFRLHEPHCFQFVLLLPSSFHAGSLTFCVWWRKNAKPLIVFEIGKKIGW